MTREEAKTFLYSIAGDLGFNDVENYSCKDGEKMREAIQALKRESCDDCISRVDAMRAITDEWVHTYGKKTTLEDFTAALYNLPPVIPKQPVMTGEWIPVPPERSGEWVTIRTQAESEGKE